MSDEAAAEQFYAGAERRIFRWLLAVAVAGAGVAFAMQRWAFAWGFVTGAVVGAVNFGWLKSAVNTMVDRMVAQGRESTPGSGQIVVKFLLRYGLIALVAYVILNSSALSIYGFLVGLLLPIAAVMCEAGYEAYVALRRGI
jgi:hypothetical protein